MGGGSGILSPVTNTLFGKPKTVDIPNYSNAAQQTAASDLAANRLNQTNAYGSLNYNQTGTDQYGNPTYTQSQTLNPQLQSAINSNMGQLGQPFQAPQFQGQDMASMNYFGSRLNQQQFNPATQLKPLAEYDVNTQINQAALPSYGINPGQTYSDAIMQRLQPSLQRQTQALDAQLANQALGMQAQNQAFAQAMAQSNLPYQQAGMLQGLASPQFASYATTMPTNYSGAMQQSYQGNLANANAQNAYNNSFTSGLFNLGGSALMGRR